MLRDKWRTDTLNTGSPVGPLARKAVKTSKLWQPFSWSTPSHGKIPASNPQNLRHLLRHFGRRFPKRLANFFRPPPSVFTAAPHCQRRIFLPRIDFSDFV